jgi:hypothetical protein
VMRQVAIIFCMMLLTLTGCTDKTDKTNKTFQPISPNPEYIIVIKKQTPNKVLGSVIIQGDQIKQIVDEINSSYKSVAIKGCPASIDSFDVIVHYANGLLDRTFTALICPGTADQADGITIEPGISVQTLDKLFKH